MLDQATFARAENLAKGGYVLVPDANPRILLIGTGSEVQLALEAREELSKEGIRSSVVSMPSWELFEQQPQEYRDSVLPPEVKARVAVEAGVKLGWEKYLGEKGGFVGMSSFGMSAPVGVVFRNFGITVDHVVEAAKRSIA